MSWFARSPDRVLAISDSLKVKYPNLHLYTASGGAEIRGTFPIVAPDGSIVDRWAICIELSPDDPRVLPKVRMLDNRIPELPENHVNRADGYACVVLPEDYYRRHPGGLEPVEFLNGPLRCYLLGQSLHIRGEDWPFGAWGHGQEGLAQFYKELLGLDDKDRIRSYLEVISHRFQGHPECPCGSGKKIRNCHREELLRLQGVVGRSTAKTLLGLLKEK